MPCCRQASGGVDHRTVDLQVLRALHQWFTIAEDATSIKSAIETFDRQVEEGEISRPHGDNVPTVRRPAHILLAVQCLARFVLLCNLESLR